MPSAVSQNGRFVFIHPRKTGGNSVYYALKDLCDITWPTHPHLTLEEVLENVPSASEYFCFMTVRNPWERCASWLMWHWKHRDYSKSLEDAVDIVMPCSSYGLDKMNLVLRTDCLERDFAYLCGVLRLGNRQIERMNASTPFDYRIMFSDELREKVRLKFAVDIERLGYSF